MCLCIPLCLEVEARPVSAMPMRYSFHAGSPVLVPPVALALQRYIWDFSNLIRFIFTIFFFFYSFPSFPPLLDMDFEEPTVTLEWG